jgi:secreted protein with Ig-like and vWFA domain
MDDMEVNIEDLAIDEIRELLLEAGAEISLEQAEQLARFITQTGGLEEALEAVQQLAGQRKAA